MSWLTDLREGIRLRLVGLGLTVVPASAAASDRTVILSVVPVVDQADADGTENQAGSVDVRVTLIYRGPSSGDTRWHSDTQPVVQGSLGSILGSAIGGVPVAYVHWQYSAELGIADGNRWETSDNYMLRVARPALV